MGEGEYPGAGPAAERAGTPPAETVPVAAGLPLDPSPAQAEALLERAATLVAALFDGVGERPVEGDAPDPELIAGLLADRPGAPVHTDDALATLMRAVAQGHESRTGGHLAYIPGSGLLTASLGELLASASNRYTGLQAPSPGAVALEAGVLGWLCELFGMPDGAQAVLLSGGSMANLTALVAARERQAPGEPHRATVYVGEQAHASVRKAARTIGILPEHVRVCPSADGMRLDVEAIRVLIKQDRADGLVPTAVVAAAGTTNTGAVDCLPALADLAAELGVWLHVDGAYGGFFQLTERGRARLEGIERADSITLDPHKSLFLPFGTGALVVRERSSLTEAFGEDADYLRDLPDPAQLPDLAELTPELTREWRGAKLWLPLKLHGLAPFVDALDADLDLAAEAHDALAAMPGVTTCGAPDLSIVGFRVPGDDAAQDAALAHVNAEGRVRLSSTNLEGQVVLRLAVLSHRTRRHHVEYVLDRVREVVTGA
ncbi:pyridoxal phosphate-dependent decarboxylase family protein [Egicoccus halophilus]|uniref:L-2,4-diaminobutyrate decarboxylase n=1 Tax=Egicoccus halophilus TaxID=1670830 RepID=A0A8J3AHC7_9ACTN|nr:aminotransferase class I/II-fold pyridoxal phosphate-dependent enzyme [Egicoccus halophilus]GGI09325.1 L-2,4-diaminobutyrate decarboxylase [Egicoccus halophilus]